ncbi:MAG: zinc-dependent metalloprotease [Rhodobacteraceae bacterium]|nr:zinc-dependent metalloprotease [Paracoccaceae bacterium]
MLRIPSTFAVTMALLLSLLFQPSLAQDAAPAEAAEAGAAEEAAAAVTIEALLATAEKLGEGPAQLYSIDGSTVMVINPAVFGQLIHWYAEAVKLPPQAVSQGGNAVGETVVRLERRGSKVFIRDMGGEFSKRIAAQPAGDPLDTNYEADLKLSPLQMSVGDVRLGGILFSFDILAENEDGTVLVDLTSVFTGDMGNPLSTSTYLSTAGVAVIAADPDRSYIESAKSFEGNISIRSQLTFIDVEGTAVSIVVGHTLSLLPVNQMEPRAFDDQVGFFETSFAEFGGENAATSKAYIIRHRLEKADPSVEGPSDPVEPIVYYIGRGVPDRWRPYIKDAVESWQSAFEEAGFTNAIIARNAPSIEEDPDWSAEDTRINVIRWLPQAFENATGPVTIDPRTGEILGAHILLWPQVFDFFAPYYFSMHSTVDPDAASYPLSEEKMGQLLAYIVAHEVGHTLGLRHNHLASTAYTTAEQRDPEFANENGAAPSIMAYGRFNQAAQPGDGVTSFVPGIGAYDRFAIKWGYQTFPDKSPEEVAQILSDQAKAATKDRELRWAANEAPSESRWQFDPRLQRENTGADRVEATRLGILRLRATLENLTEATGGDVDNIRLVYNSASGTMVGFLTSVMSLVGGVENTPGENPRYQFVSREEQKDAVRYLVGEGVQSLDALEEPSIIRLLDPAGYLRLIDGNRELILLQLMAGSKLALLEMQHRQDPEAYSVVEFATDLEDVIFANLTDPTRSEQTMQAAFMVSTAMIFSSPATRNQIIPMLTATLSGEDPNATLISSATGAGTAFYGWAKEELPQLSERLTTAAASAETAELRYHFAILAERIDALLARPLPSAADAFK